MSEDRLTPSQTAGPFLAIGFSPLTADAIVDPATSGSLVISGHLLDGGGAAVADGAIEIWQADRAGRFPPDTEPGWSGFARCLTDSKGAFGFVTVKPGSLVAVDGRAQAPHLELMIVARGLLRALFTRVYFPDEEAANARDLVLQGVPEDRRHTLIARPQGSDLIFDVHLQGDRETVFFGA
jgi:protocatechuate 3,4-dioxygenase, alpha subunit